MKVEIRTRVESGCTPPKPSVYIQANEVLYSMSAIEEKIRALQTARAWLKRELAK